MAMGQLEYRGTFAGLAGCQLWVTANCPTTMIESARWKNSVDPSIVDPGCIHRSWLEYPIPDLGNGLVRQVVGHATNIGRLLFLLVGFIFRRENFLLLLPIPEAREFDLSSFGIFSVSRGLHTRVQLSIRRRFKFSLPEKERKFGEIY